MPELPTLTYRLQPVSKARHQLLRWQEERHTADPDAWRRANPLAPPSGGGIVRFIVPLISRSKARDWSVVCRNLARTVASLRRQTDPNWRATICCQTRPDGIDWDERVRFLRFPFMKRTDASDKNAKLRHLLRETARQDRADGYPFFLDADDILHPRLVAHMRT